MPKLLTRFVSLVLPPEDKRILHAAIMELQECINDQYHQYGATDWFFSLCELLDERLNKLNENFES